MKNYIKFVGASLLGGVIALGGYFLIEQHSLDTDVNYSEDIVLTSSNTLKERLPQVDFVDAASDVTPAVVKIKSLSRLNTNSGMRRSPYNMPYGFEQYFGGRQPIEGTGSGVIISSDGYIVTNNHVVDGFEEIVVILSDNTERVAERIGSDPKYRFGLIEN